MKIRRSLELVNSLSGLLNTLRKIPFLVMYHPGNFDGLMQSGFWVIPKITFAILCKPIQFYLTLWIW